MTGARLSACAGHEALAKDIRFVNGLLWYRHIRDRLNQEEWAVPQELS